MAGRSYERLDIVPFGRHLLESGDLDPVYIALQQAELPRRQLHRWLLAYWCLYHVGAASWLSEQTGANFWDRLGQAARNEQPAPTGERWPRGHERRHFRGAAAVKAVEALASRYGSRPEGMVSYVATGDPGSVDPDMGNQWIPISVISERVREHPLFGPWIAFKVGDMLERLAIAPVSFDQGAVFMFKDPVEAALRLWRHSLGLPDHARPRLQGDVITQVVHWLEQQFIGATAPPLHDREIRLQEIETILCKWKSHMNGHYPLNNDILEIRDGLLPWLKTSKTAQLLWSFMPTPMDPVGSS